MIPKTLFLRFYECEHGGDLEHYLTDLRESGATLLRPQFDPDAEEAVVEFTVTDFPAFKTAFQQTDSADFADSLDWLEESHA